MCLSGGRRVSSSGDWDLGNPAFAISHGSRDTTALTPGLTIASLACCCSFHLSAPGKPLDPRTLLRVHPGCAGDTTERLAAQFASRSSDSRRGVGPSLRSAYRTRASRPDPDGVTTFRTHELRPGWVPPLPRGRWCSSRLRAIPSRHPPLRRGQSLSLATSSHQRGSCDEASTEVYAHHANAKLVFRVSIVRDASDSGLYRMVEHSRRARRPLPRRDT